jgi:hypothetical protein
MELVERQRQKKAARDQAELERRTLQRKTYVALCEAIGFKPQPIPYENPVRISNNTIEIAGIGIQLLYDFLKKQEDGDHK